MFGNGYFDPLIKYDKVVCSARVNIFAAAMFNNNIQPCGMVYSTKLKSIAFFNFDESFK